MGQGRKFAERYSRGDKICDFPGYLLEHAFDEQQQSPCLLLRIKTGAPNPFATPGPRLRAHFLNDLCSIAEFHHPQIATIRDFGVVQHFLYIAYEDFQGETLHLAEGWRTRVEVLDVGPIILAVLSGIAAAHNRELIHGILFPGLIMVEHPGSIKILGLGLRSLVPLMLNGAFAFQALQYQAPETIVAGISSKISDVFSVGALLYELLTGLCPFPGGDIPTLKKRVGMGEILPITSVAPSVPQPVTEVLARAMKFLPADRFPSCEEFSAALAQVIPAEPVSGLEVEQSDHSESPSTIITAAPIDGPEDDLTPILPPLRDSNLASASGLPNDSAERRIPNESFKADNFLSESQVPDEEEFPPEVTPIDQQELASLPHDEDTPVPQPESNGPLRLSVREPTAALPTSGPGKNLTASGVSLKRYLTPRYLRWLLFALSGILLAGIAYLILKR